MSDNSDLINAENFRDVTKWFLRYILITSCRYTRDKNILAYIGLYCLISTYQWLKNSRDDTYIGYVIDTMLETVAQDVTASPAKAETIFDGKLLTGNTSAVETIYALNQLPSLQRQIVVLYDIEMLTTAQLQQLIGISIQQVRAELKTAEESVEQCLGKINPSFGSVIEQINVTGTMMDMDLIGTIAQSAGEYIDKELQG